MSLSDKLKNTRPRPRPRAEPLWAGPCGEGPQGGVTQSMLSRFLVCRERFRLKVVEGLTSDSGFDHRMEFGNMWHLCEERHAEGLSMAKVIEQLQAYARNLCRQHPTQQEQVDHWYNICKRQFPLYVDYWAKHPDIESRTPLLQEQVFDVPYRLPSGRTVRLRGKWDSVDLVGKGANAGIWLMENKTKGQINEGQMRRQLTFDLQTMMYLIALESCDVPIRDLNKPFHGYDPKTTKLSQDQLNGLFKKLPIIGVRYNVIRRPLSGGKGSIIRHKATAGSKCGPCKGTGYKDAVKCLKCRGAGRVGAKPEESKADFYDRVVQYIRDEPETYFMRWNVVVTPGDIAKFRREFLDPILEQLCDWWEWVIHCYAELDESKRDPFRPRTFRTSDGRFIPTPHWRHPFGVRNIMDEGGYTDVDEYLASGSEIGLRRAETLFGELEEPA